ncbi:hypothetical protein M0804_009913 [Polistes exclamans]|nr:hypothetical protein M0804_009913 [Polistes exclamans]
MHADRYLTDATTRYLNNRRPYENDMIENDVLVRRKGNTNLVMVPKCLEIKVLKKVHDNRHFGVTKMVKTIEDEFLILRLEDKKRTD